MNVMDRLIEHYNEALKYFPEDRIVGIFLQGSQNYGLEIENSDVDSKLIVVPTFEEIAFNKKPHSTTHVRENEEHIDFKDLRLMFQTFRKQNLNFVEILFTDYKILNHQYSPFWDKLVEQNELIAHYNPYGAVKTMKGIAMEKFHAMEHEYPSKVEVLKQFGYDPKQLHHLLRVDEYLMRYISGEKYADCLKSNHADFLKEVKRGCFNLEKARTLGAETLEHVTLIADIFCEQNPPTANPEVDTLLDKVQLDIMWRAMASNFMCGAM